MKLKYHELAMNKLSLTNKELSFIVFNDRLAKDYENKFC